MVCGGGVAGVAAATCAARHGARVILLERYGYLGGLATGGLVITVPPLDNGINCEVRLRLEAARTYQECANLGDDPAVDGLIAVDPEILKFELLTLLLDSGVKMLLHTSVVGSLESDGRVGGVIIESKAGRAAIRAQVVIDTTGDGDLAAAAGAAYDLDERPLPVTLMSTVVGVDAERALAQLGSWGNLRDLVARRSRPASSPSISRCAPGSGRPASLPPSSAIRARSTSGRAACSASTASTPTT